MTEDARLLDESFTEELDGLVTALQRPNLELQPLPQ